MAAQRRCETCRFYWKAARHCRRFPPVPVTDSYSLMMPYGSHAKMIAASGTQVWPIMQENDWCGEWAEAEERGS